MDTCAQAMTSISLMNPVLCTYRAVCGRKWQGWCYCLGIIQDMIGKSLRAAAFFYLLAADFSWARCAMALVHSRIRRVLYG